MFRLPDFFQAARFFPGCQNFLQSVGREREHMFYAVEVSKAVLNDRGTIFSFFYTILYFLNA